MESEIKIPVPWGIISGKTWGKSCDLPVLMIHGLQDNAGSFDNLIPLLPQTGFYYICIDLPGHGKSSHYPRHLCYTIMSFVENLRIIVVERLKLERFYFVGHSMGGHIGYIFTAAFPELVLKFVAIDVILTWVVRRRLVHEKVGERLNAMVHLERRMQEREAPEYSYEEAVQRVVTARMTSISEDGAKLLVRRSLYKTKTGYRFLLDPRLRLNVLTEMSLEQYKGCIDNIKCPMLYVAATDTGKVCGGTLRRNHKFLFKDKQNYELHVVKGNHDVHIENPESIAPIISKFLLADTNSKL